MNRQLATATADFRTYEPEIQDDGNGFAPTVTRLCEELVDGRWEPFISYVPLSEARRVLAAAGYDTATL